MIFYAHTGRQADKSDWEPLPEHAALVERFALEFARFGGLEKAARGPLGSITFGEVDVRRRCPRSETFDPSQIDEAVQLLKLCLGTDPRMIAVLRELGDSAIVIEAFGLGNAPPTFLRPVEECVRSGIPVIVVSRCAEGPTYPPYGNGGDQDLERAGALFASDLSGSKARILASVFLGSNLSDREFAESFNRCAAAGAS